MKFLTAVTSSCMFIFLICCNHCVQALTSETDFPRSTKIIDITSFFDGNLTTDSDYFTTMLSDSSNNEGRINFYYETDLNMATIDNLRNVSSWVEGVRYHQNDHPNIVVNLRYDSLEIVDEPRRMYIPKSFQNISMALGTLPLLNILAFEYVGPNISCDSLEKPWWENELVIAENVKSMLLHNCKKCIDKFKAGITVDHQLFGCRYFDKVVFEADVFIPKINFLLNHNFVESYGAVKNFLDSVHHQIGRFIRDIRKDRVFILYHLQYTSSGIPIINGDTAVRLNSEESEWYRLNITSERSEEIRLAVEHHVNSVKELKIKEKYRCLFKQYIHEWLSSVNIVAVLQVEDYCESCYHCDSISSQSAMLPMMPDVSRIMKRVDPSSDSSCSWLMAIKLAMKNIREQGFNSVVLFASPMEVTMPSLKNSNCKTSEVNSTISSNGNKFIVQENITSFYYPIYHYNAFDELRPRDNGPLQHSFYPILEAFGFTKQRLTIDWSAFEQYNKPLEQVISLKRSTGFACFVSAVVPSSGATFNTLGLTLEYALASTTLEFCEDVIIGAQFYFDISGSFLNSQQTGRNGRLENLQQRFMLTRSLIQRKWPSKNVMLGFSISFTPPQTISDSLFCNQRDAVESELYEAAITWATIYNIPMFFYDFKASIKWFQIAPDSDEFEEFKGIENHFPIYIRKAFNSSKVFGHWTNGMFPCLEWLNQVPVNKEEIEFGGSQIGTYMQLNLRYVGESELLKEAEISTLLLFSLTTFQFTMLEIKSVPELTASLAVLKSASFKLSLSENGVKKRKVFLNIALTCLHNNEIRLDTIYSDIKNVSSALIDFIVLKVHFSNWLNVSDPSVNLTSFANSLLEKMDTYSQSEELGIELDDCAKVIAGLLRYNLNSKEGKFLRETTSYKLLKKMTSAVCVLPTAYNVDRNRAEMQKYLETHYYIKTILHVYFPNLKQVYFKLMPRADDIEVTKEVDKLLLLLHHITNFARGYNVSYFVIPAFASENLTDNVSWWEIANYTDLSNTGVFQDIQAKFLRTETRRPILVQNGTYSGSSNETMETPSSGTSWLVFVLVVVVGALACILVGVVVKARRNAKLLSDEEVQEFLKGRQGPFDGSANDINVHHLGSGYNNEYEIPKSDIFLEPNNILGNGNFGVVYRAAINTGNDQFDYVAVKTPKKGCDKKVFIGMLREVKLHCFLGSHRNLVKFLGCYTKEIQSGLLYIVMQLYPGGSLISHLRDLKSSNIKLEENCEKLTRFCLEISSGMEYISSKNVIHGDLSARNVLLDGLNSCKICDFGLSRKLYEYRTYSKKTEEPLPWRWMSYESLANLEFSTMSDVWSFAVTAWEIFSLGDLPYPGLTWTADFMKELEDGKRLSAPPLASTEIYEKMTTCWNRDPEQRPDFTHLVAFFTNFVQYSEVT